MYAENNKSNVDRLRDYVNFLVYHLGRGIVPLSAEELLISEKSCVAVKESPSFLNNLDENY